MKDRLIFVPTDSTGSDNVGAFLKDASGNLITSTLIGSNQALDVNIISGTDDGIFAEDAASTDGDKGQVILGVRQDSLASSVSDDGDYGWLKFDARGAQWVAPVGGVADDAADDGQYPIKMGGVADSVLAAVSDGDRVQMVSDLYRRIRVNDAPDVAVLQSQSDVANVEAAMGTNLAGRKQLFVQNLSTSRDIYVGATGVTTADGFQIRRGTTWVFDMGPNIALKAIGVDATAADIRQLELA